MSLRKRVLKVTIGLPSGNIVLDETLNMKVRIHKTALSIQNKATIEVSNLATTVRKELLSNLSAWQQKQRDQFGNPATVWPVTIEAGYIDASGASTVATIYVGETVVSSLAAPPPDITLRLECMTHQVDKTTWVTEPSPDSMRFRDLVIWAADKMGIPEAQVICQTSHDDEIIQNPARSRLVASSILPYIQDYYHPNVVATIDDNFLIVTDRDKAIQPNDIVQLNEFIGIPTWTEYGMEAEILLNTGVRVAKAVNLTSIMNPTLNGGFVVMELDYDLTTRETPFYVKVSGIPPAATTAAPST